MARRSKHLITWLLVLTFSFFTPAFHPWAYADDMWTKLGRGFSNVFTGWYEVVYQCQEASKTNRWPVAVAVGMTKGPFMWVVRTVVGAVEMATFPIPIPWKYEPILKPEFIVPPSYPPRGQWPDFGEEQPVRTF